MNIPLQLQSFTVDHLTIDIFVPQLQQVQSLYLSQKQTNANTPFPYWARVWPSAIAMADFLVQHSNFIQNKRILEIAAGLGLPSIAAAHFASKVTISDYLPEAIDTLQKTIAHNQLKNTEAVLLDWYHLPESLDVDVLLLSDINYEPAAFNALHQLVIKFIQKGVTIILTTPQRLMAKPFIDLLLPYCTSQQQKDIVAENTTTPVSIFILQPQ